MKHLWIALISIVALAMLTGCGGGAGTTLATSSVPVRQIQAGDEVVYSTHTDGDVFNHDTASKVTIQEDTSAPVYGDRRLKMVVEFYTSDGGDVLAPVPDDEHTQIDAAIEQDSDGTIYEIPYNKTPKNEVGKPVSIPGTLRVGEAYSYSCEYAEGGTYSTRTRVVATERIDGYTAYKLHTESIRRNMDGIGYSSESTDAWVVPELGRDIRWQTEETVDGDHLSSVTRLTSRNY